MAKRQYPLAEGRACFYQLASRSAINSHKFRWIFQLLLVQTATGQFDPKTVIIFVIRNTSENKYFRLFLFGK